ncbi:hypothetical protein JB92DRAFT_2887789 [Gautieria morchelliformis]|nr:hypothetical protein JB92DRAFT_2887789 [Gautieria morchelliformis]
MHTRLDDRPFLKVLTGARCVFGFTFPPVGCLTFYPPDRLSVILTLFSVFLSSIFFSRSCLYISTSLQHTLAYRASSREHIPLLLP